MTPTTAGLFASPPQPAGPAALAAVRRLVRAGLATVFGPPPFDPHADPGDPGLFGPGSPSWRIIAEPAAIAGGFRALLVQLLHPLAMAGVAQHSRFRDSPLVRLRNTSAYVTTTTFGSTREALAVAQRVRSVHRRVRGSYAGVPYSADDPHLLAWVSISLTSSFLATDGAYAAAPVDAATADRFVAEQALAAALLDPRVDLDALPADPAALARLRAGTLPLPLIEEGVVPLTVVQLRAALTRFRAELRLTDEAREALRFLLWPNVPPAVKAGYLPLLTAAIATLEPAERDLLELPATPASQLPARVAARSLMTLLRVLAGPSQAVPLATARARASPTPAPGVVGGEPEAGAC